MDKDLSKDEIHARRRKIIDDMIEQKKMWKALRQDNFFNYNFDVNSDPSDEKAYLEYYPRYIEDCRMNREEEYDLNAEAFGDTLDDDYENPYSEWYRSC